MEKLILSIILISSLAFIGCTKDKEVVGGGSAVVDDGSVSEGVLTGMVQAHSFTAKGGKVENHSSSGEEDVLWVHITNEEVGCGSDFIEYGYRLYIEVPIKTGTYLNTHVTFIKKGKNESFVDPKGTVIVDEITDSEVTLRVKSKHSAIPQNSIEGKITLPYCKSNE